MDMVIEFPGKSRVDAQWGGFTIATDQVPPTGDGSAPAPFDLFLASIGTCAGIYVLGFCRQRNIATEGMRLIQRMQFDPETHMVTKIAIDIQLPPDFPDKYKDAIIRVAEQCKVKKHLAQPPAFEINAVAAVNPSV
jgi:putative redox protein